MLNCSFISTLAERILSTILCENGVFSRIDTASLCSVLSETQEKQGIYNSSAYMHVLYEVIGATNDVFSNVSRYYIHIYHINHYVCFVSLHVSYFVQYSIYPIYDEKFEKQNLKKMITAEKRKRTNCMPSSIFQDNFIKKFNRHSKSHVSEVRSNGESWKV